MIQMTQAASLLVTQNLVIDVTLRRMSKMMKDVEHAQKAFSKIFMERNGLNALRITVVFGTI